MLAIVFACLRFDQLIVGNPQTLIKTDHKPLVNIFTKPLLSVPKRLQKMLMTLQRYNIKLQFVSGKENIAADTLSRAPIPSTQRDSEVIKLCTVYRTSEESICKCLESINLTEQVSVSDERLEEIRKETSKDLALQKLSQFILGGWPNNIYGLPDEIKRYNAYKHELTLQNGLIFKGKQICHTI